MFFEVTFWAKPSVRLRLSGRNSGKIPERPQKRSQSVSWNSPREYGWDPPKPYNSRHLKATEHFRNCLPPRTAGDAFFFQKWSRRGPLRAGHGIPSSTGGISDFQRPCEVISKNKPLKMLSSSFWSCTIGECQMPLWQMQGGSGTEPEPETCPSVP